MALTDLYILSGNGSGSAGDYFYVFQVRGGRAYVDQISRFDVVLRFNYILDGHKIAQPMEEGGVFKNMA